MEGYQVIHMRSFEDGEEIWKIAIPQTLLLQLLHWYHLVFGQCGQQRLYNTVKAQFHSANLQRHHCIKMVKQCPQRCQLNKESNKNYCHLPLWTAGLFPWETVAVDLIGPWKIKINGIELKFRGLTCINPVSNIVEAIQIQNKTSKHIAENFSNCLLSRYPKLVKCIHDNRGES